MNRDDIIRMAREALEGVVSAHAYESGTPVEAITALKAALAQQAEPVEGEKTMTTIYYWCPLKRAYVSLTLPTVVAFQMRGW